MEEGEIGDFPDELRCRRSDGRQWRCKKRVVGESKMCEYHLHRSTSAAKGRVRRLVVKKEKGLTDDQMPGLKSVERKRSVEKAVEENGVQLVDGVSEEKRLEVGLVVRHCSVSTSGRKRKRVKRYGDDDDDEDLNRGSEKKDGNVLKRTKKRDVQVVRRVALDEESVPDHLRCTRTDGRRWRCFRRVKDGVTLCENHYLQGRLRQVRAVVPESLKLQRRDRLTLFKCSQGRISKIAGGKKRRPEKWRQWSTFSEALDDALIKLQLRKSDVELQLLKAYMKRQAEKLELQQQFFVEGYCQKEVTKDLPFGAMTISASPALQAPSIAGTSCNMKIGSDLDSLSGVSFRSKNIEPVSIGSSKVMPGVKEIVKLKRAKKRCHMCKKPGSRMTKCSTCKKELFCIECIKKRYFTSREDVEKSCPACRKECSCDTCLLNQSKDAKHQDNPNDERRMEKVAHIRQLIYLLLPVLKHIKDEQRFELQLEAKIKGKEQCEVLIQQVENGCDKQLYCKNCKNCIVDVHRSCEDCSYSICLNCSRDLSEGLTEGVDTVLSKYFDRTKNERKFSHELPSPLSSHYWKFGVNGGNICCPPVNFGGCGHGLLVLRSVFTASWINELEERAAKAVSTFNHTDGIDVSTCSDTGHESEIMNQVQQASSRQNSDDNFLYYPIMKDGRLLDNFHDHWQKHHPIVVRNVLQQKSDLRWDPIFFFCSYLERCRTDSPDAAEVEASNCLNWCEVEIGIRQSYVGHLKGWNHANMWNETLKLKGHLASHILQRKFPDHYAGIVHSLPYQEYMNPMVGRSNLAVNLPPEVKPDLGPYVHFSYGIGSDSVDAMGKLCYNSYDSVNIMVHATAVPVPSEQITRVRKLMEKKWYEYQDASTVITSDVTSPKKKRKPSKKGDSLTVAEVSNEDSERPTTCEGESGESCNSVVVHESSGRSAANVNRLRESTSDSEASNLCSEKPDDQIIVQNFGNSDAAEDSPSISCGAEWDVFRREDIPALLDYLKKNSEKLSHTSNNSKNAGQPILGQSVFLDAMDKSRLKEEYNIEPWTFKQRVGEAVIVPAGCPYQIRTLKSCVSVAFDFVSLESASASIHLSDELRLLSEVHDSNEHKLEVWKMVLYNISAALQQLRELNSAD
ncbi:unnamed protein product [Rhodiola kirilowii]